MRPATVDDLSELAHLQRAFYEEDAIEHRPEVERALAALLADRALGVVIASEGAGGALAGYVAMTWGYCVELGGRDAFVDELYVAPAARGRGVGRALLRAGIAAAEREGALTVHLEVAAPDEGKTAFYASEGFRPRPYPLMTRRRTGE